MKAVRMHDYGGPEQLLYEDAPDPEIAHPEEVIVRLKAAALNRIDIWNRLGVTGQIFPMPHILGADGAGVVAEVGAVVRHLRVGDPVCLYPPTGCAECEFCARDHDFMCLRLRALGERLEGTYAEYVKLPAKNCYPIPAGFSFQEAAAFPLVFVTVWRMLFTNARLKPGETVLIVGIGGGVASAALQVAARIGARVIVTSSSDAKLDRARSLGAFLGVNHRAQDVAAEVMAVTGDRGVDVVLDCVAGEFWPKSLQSLGRGGRLVTCGATAGVHAQDDLDAVFSKQLKIYGSTLGSREEFRQVLSFLNVAGIRPVIDREFSLEEAAAAQRRLEAGQQFGKVVLRTAN